MSEGCDLSPDIAAGILDPRRICLPSSLSEKASDIQEAFAHGEEGIAHGLIDPPHTYLGGPDGGSPPPLAHILTTLALFLPTHAPTVPPLPYFPVSHTSTSLSVIGDTPPPTLGSH